MDDTYQEIVKQLRSIVGIDFTLLAAFRDFLHYATLFGVSLLGGFLGAYYRKRGEVAAIKTDLDEITRIQEEIKAKLSFEAKISQNWWELKRDIYSKLILALNDMADAYWHIVHDGFDESGTPSTDRTHYMPFREKADKAMDDYMSLTGISHVVLDRNAIAQIQNLSSGFGEVHRNIKEGRLSREDAVKLKSLVDCVYDRIIEVARSDLQGKIQM